MLGGLALAILGAASLAYRQPLSAFLWPVRRFDLGQFAVGLVGMTCVTIIAVPFYYWQGAEWAPPISDGRYLDWTRPVYLLLMTGGLLIAAAAEEVVCRGFMLRLTALIIRHPLVLCLVNGLVFSSLHLDPDPVAFVARTLSGMVWAWAALRLGGLEFAIGAHLANNLVISLIREPLSEIEGGSDSSWIALAPEIVISAIMVLLIERLATRLGDQPSARLTI
jgi:membrane protease YdiL (CAAX protease family)